MKIVKWLIGTIMVLGIINCGGNGAKQKLNEQQSTENQSSNSNSSTKLLVSKELIHFEEIFDGEILSSRNVTTTYEYNSKNQSQKSISTTVIKNNDSEIYRNGICTDNYDSQDRLIGSVCTIKTTENGITKSSTEHITYHYSGNKVVSYDYDNEYLSGKVEVTQWDENKAIEWKSTSYNNEHTETRVSTATYTGKNVTHIKEVDSNSDEYSITDITFDNKKTPYYWSTPFNDGYWWVGGVEENNILKEIIRTNSSNDIYTTTVTNNITYNSSNMPTNIETITTMEIPKTININIGNYETQMTTTYEYIEAK